MKEQEQQTQQIHKMVTDFDKINFDKNLVNICVNVNANEQVKVTPPPEEEEPSPCENCFSDSNSNTERRTTKYR